MKCKYFIFVITTMMVVAMISCSDSDDDIPPPPKVEDRSLVVTDTVCMMIKSLAGSSEGGIENIELGQFRKCLAEKMKHFPFSKLEEASLTFIGDTDSVMINGYVNCGYVDFLGYKLFLEARSNYGKFEYKFEDNCLKIFSEDDQDWLTFGYGNKDKIEVYFETKFMTGRSSSDEYYWEVSGNSSMTVNLSIDPQKAKTIAEEQNWKYFFDEMCLNWHPIPDGKYYAEKFESPKDFNYKSQSATWSIYKMVYTPGKTKE